MTQESIIDTSKPNAGRVYDYLLGGSHNFEVDRKTADQLVQLVPFVPKGMRLQRWCLQDIATELTTRRGFDLIVDFASGLPTNDHIHHVAAPGTTVVYSDWDSVVVEYADEILQGIQGVRFLYSDARHPEELLNHPETQAILKGRRDIAIVSWGLSAFLTDDEIAHMAQVLYEWTNEKSVWAFNAQAANGNPAIPAVAKLLAIYQQMGTPFHIRSVERYLELLKPWRPETSFVPLIEWHGFDQSIMEAKDLEAAGPGGGGYGAYLVK